MTNDDTYLQLQRKEAELKTERDQAAGAEAELLKQMKDDFGVETMEELEAKIRVLKKKHARLEEEEKTEYARLQKKHPKLFED